MMKSETRHGADAPVEFGWFAPCCEDDYEFLGVPDPALASTPEHVRDVVLAADRAGFKNILLPSGFNTGVDAWTMAAALSERSETSICCRRFAWASTTRPCSPAPRPTWTGCSVAN
jgi:hypothetical protein